MDENNGGLDGGCWLSVELPVEVIEYLESKFDVFGIPFDLGIRYALMNFIAEDENPKNSKEMIEWAKCERDKIVAEIKKLQL